MVEPVSTGLLVTTLVVSLGTLLVQIVKIIFESGSLNCFSNNTIVKEVHEYEHEHDDDRRGGSTTIDNQMLETILESRCSSLAVPNSGSHSHHHSHRSGRSSPHFVD